MSSEPRPLQRRRRFARCVAAARNFLGPRSRRLPGADDQRLRARTPFGGGTRSPDFVIVDGRGIAEPTAADRLPRFGQPALSDLPLRPGETHRFCRLVRGRCPRRAPHAGEPRRTLGPRPHRCAVSSNSNGGCSMQSSRSTVPGMYSRRGLLRKLRKLAASDEAGRSAAHAAGRQSIDWYAGIRRKSGETASRSLVNTAARAIKRAVGDGAICCVLRRRPIRHAAGRANRSPPPRAAAESLAKDFGSRESHHESIPRPTLTQRRHPVDRRQQCRPLPERRPGNARPGRALGRRLRHRARRVQPGTRRVAGGNVDRQSVRQCRRAGHHGAVSGPAWNRTPSRPSWPTRSARAGIPVRPYVDRDGRLVGVADDETAAAETRIGQPATAHDRSRCPKRLPYDASFPEIYEAFSSRGCSTLVVTADDHPLGYLTCDGFLSMIDPIHAESLRVRSIGG